MSIKKRLHKSSIILFILFVVIVLFWIFFARMPSTRSEYIQSIEGAITVGGFVSLLAALVFSLIQSKAVNIKVVTIMRSNSEFAESLSQGIIEVIAAHPRLSLEQWTIDDIDQEDQHLSCLAMLRKAQSDASIDAVIVRPIYDREDVRAAIIETCREGIFVIAIDTIIDVPPLDYKLLEYPFYIRIDHRSGGVKLAKFIRRHCHGLSRDLSKAAVVALVGPAQSAPGTSRSMWLLWTLLEEQAGEGLGQSIFPIFLANWDRECAIHSFGKKMPEILANMKQNDQDILYIYCGIDSICLLIDRYFMENAATWRNDMPALELYTLGYDGVRRTTRHGSYHVQAASSCIATIDVNPVQIGTYAASIIRARVERGGYPVNNGHLFDPQLRVFVTPHRDTAALRDVAPDTGNCETQSDKINLSTDGNRTGAV